MSAVTVVHKLPHRTRLRVPPGHRSSEHMTRMQEALKKAKGVRSVEINHKTGSILVHHDPAPGLIDSLGTIMSEASGLLPLIIPDAELEVEGASEIANMIHDTFKQADHHFASSTDNWIDLKMLVPVLLAVAGLRKLSADKSLLADVSPFVLFYYAFDVYLKLHRSEPVHTKRRNRKNSIKMITG